MSVECHTTLASVLTFWFNELQPRQWFRRDERIDTQIQARFAALHAQAMAGELWQWRDSDDGRLAEILVLDQFSRNLFRNDARAWQGDPMALVLAQEAIDRGVDRRLDLRRRPFIYMPLMHSESLAIHRQALILFDQPGLEDHLREERRHFDTLHRFGRYPWRNAALGRETLPEEQGFLDAPGNR